MKIAVAMSGGVDSSVAAALLKKQGHDVIGMTLQLWPPAGENGDFHAKSVETSRAVAEKLGIPHVVIDGRDIFSDIIVDEFCREYGNGRTPNPCVRCNKHIKFGFLVDRARESGADYLATGHYARVERNKDSGAYTLKKGKDSSKDQSYFLCMLDREQLSHTVFPVGNMTKSEVIKVAEEMGLPIKDKRESQEICFIPNNDYAHFVAEHLPGVATPGPVYDRKGNVLGNHNGISGYTIGQRKGLGIAAAEPLYVTAIEPAKNAVYVGGKNEIYSDELTASELNWISGTLPKFPLKIKARIRYRHPEADAVVTPLDEDNIHVKFNEPQMAITPGQTVVFYHGDTVIGGGIIN